ncbi:MAG: DUF58 domain-containing protein [Pseudomonadota bacterium]
MFFERRPTPEKEDPTGLTLEELIAIQPRHVRGRLVPGRRRPEGERPGRGRSTSLDFDGLSPYLPGDDVRAIDWRATMRSGQTTVRRFAAASYCEHMLVVDLRPDLFFGTADRLMAKTACLATAWMAWKALALNEPVGMIAGAKVMTPLRGRKHVLRLLDSLVDAYEQENGPGLREDDLETAGAILGQRDEVCVITDLPVDPQAMVAFGSTMARSRRLRCVLVEDPMTRQPLPAGRYPVRRPDGQRQVIRVSGGRPAEGVEETRLKDAGWLVDRALDLLPRTRPS